MRYELIFSSLVLVCGCDSKDVDAMDTGHDTEAGAETGDEPDDGTGTGDEPPDDGASSETGDDGRPDAALCDTPDPDVDGTFDVAFGDWELDSDEVFLHTECTVDSVGIVDGAISTALTCLDPQDDPRPVDVQVAATEAGTPAWSPGDEVTLDVSGSNYVGGFLPGGIRSAYEVSAFSMRRADDGGLLATGGSGPSGDFTPLELEVTDMEICGSDPPDEPCGSDRPLAFRVSEPGGAQLDLLGGQRGVLLLIDGSELHVDAPIAHASSDCHSSTDFRIVSRRMIP